MNYKLYELAAAGFLGCESWFTIIQKHCHYYLNAVVIKISLFDTAINFQGNLWDRNIYIGSGSPPYSHSKLKIHLPSRWKSSCSEMKIYWLIEMENVIEKSSIFLSFSRLPSRKWEIKIAVDKKKPTQESEIV
jgi:hypothetical protein